MKKECQKNELCSQEQKSLEISRELGISKEKLKSDKECKFNCEKKSY